jgi:hypothetical protein
MAIFFVFSFLSVAVMVVCEATVLLAGQGLSSINKLEISESLRGGMNHPGREANCAAVPFQGLLNILLIFAPIFLINSVHSECNESSVAAKICVIVDGTESETEADSGAQKKMALRKAPSDLLRKTDSLSRKNSGTVGESHCTNLKFSCRLMVVAGRLACQRTQDFWRALPKAKISDDGNVLCLVNNTFFLGIVDFGDKLLIRNCYHGLLRRIETHFQSNRRGVVVVGNPGMQPDQN